MKSEPEVYSQNVSRAWLPHFHIKQMETENKPRLWSQQGQFRDHIIVHFGDLSAVYPRNILFFDGIVFAESIACVPTHVGTIHVLFAIKQTCRMSNRVADQFLNYANKFSFHIERINTNAVNEWSVLYVSKVPCQSFLIMICNAISVKIDLH